MGRAVGFILATQAAFAFCELFTRMAIGVIFSGPKLT
jgi:hypothetical protein